MMKIGILGPGAVGSLVGALLLRSGQEVIFIGKAKKVESINNFGINVESKIYGNFNVKPNACSNLVEDLDIVLITVKGCDLTSALDRIPSDKKKKILFISLLNGMGHYEIIKKSGIEHFSIGTIGSVEVLIDDNNNVIHHSNVKTHIEFSVGLGYNHKDNLTIIMLLENAGLNVKFIKSINEVIWRKLIRLAPISIITSITQCSLGMIRDNTKSQSLMLQIVKEFCQISSLHDFDISPDEVLSQIKLLPDRLTTSMQRDFQNGRNTELENILGIPLAIGKNMGLSLPVLDECYIQLKKNQIN
jgi:2-dehydropantoate 2-reductase